MAVFVCVACLISSCHRQRRASLSEGDAITMLDGTWVLRNHQGVTANFLLTGDVHLENFPVLVSDVSGAKRYTGGAKWMLTPSLSETPGSWDVLINSSRNEIPGIRLEFVVESGQTYLVDEFDPDSDIKWVYIKKR